MEISKKHVFITDDFTLGDILNKTGGRKAEARVLLDENGLIFDKKTYCLACKADTCNMRGCKVKQMSVVHVETLCGECRSKKSGFHARDKLPHNIQELLPPQ